MPSKSHILRSYLYLDLRIVDDSLSAIEGSLYSDETEVRIAEREAGVGGEAGLQMVKLGGKKGSKETTQTSRAKVITDAAKFQRLYSYLEDEDAIQYYEAMDAETWEPISRNDILELAVTLSPSRMGELASKLDGFSAMAELMQIGSEESALDESTKEAIDGFRLLGDMAAKSGIPVRMNLIGNPQYTFAAHLDSQWLRVPHEQLSSEVEILCKVQRVLGPRDKYELFNPLAWIESLPIPRDQRRQMKMPKELKDTVKGPGAIVVPIAIYR